MPIINGLQTFYNKNIIFNKNVSIIFMKYKLASWVKKKKYLQVLGICTKLQLNGLIQFQNEDFTFLLEPENQTFIM